MGYEIFEMLCNKNGVKPAQVSKATGVATATLTNWKKGTYKPKLDKLQKIADYFGVSVEYLLTGHETEMIVDTKVLDHPCLHNLAFMDYVFKLWNLPPERREAVFQQIRFQTDDYEKEIKQKESSLLA